MNSQLGQVEIFWLIRTVTVNHQSPQATVEALHLLCPADMENEDRLRKLLDKTVMLADGYSAQKNFVFLVPVFIFAHGHDHINSEVCTMMTDQIRTQS